MNYFEELNAINCNDKVEKKNGLTYLSWAYAWAELKKRYPRSFYTVYENESGWNYHTDGQTAWVKTGVTVVDENVGCIEHIEYLPVMDARNKSIPLADITSFDVNKAIQRSLTKAVARHGLGLYIYAGEDLPEGSDPILVAVSLPTKEQINELKALGVTDLKPVANWRHKTEAELTGEDIQAAIDRKKKEAAK
ncbi:DUF1071 domain-containing protein [Candidatus Saccharibacteria bacterium]|nr:DUF1071 domain-containing protein [Candidatus Saccharibacteria bacterium]